MDVPRYRRLADELRAAITDGRYPVGAQLPPEVEMGRTYGVSRHTVRDALRLLREAGLVQRRRGAGTTITAREHRAFTQPLGGVGDLLQYARDARLEVSSRQVRPLTDAEAARITASGEDGWLVLSGARRSAEGPVALAEIYVAPSFASVGESVAGWPGAVQELLAQDHGAEVARIEQTITAETLTAGDARRLGVERGEAALRTLRRYLDTAGALIMASDSLHPARRFAYAMTYVREG